MIFYHIISYHIVWMCFTFDHVILYVFVHLLSNQFPLWFRRDWNLRFSSDQKYDQESKHWMLSNDHHAALLRGLRYMWNALLLTKVTLFSVSNSDWNPMFCCSYPSPKQTVWSISKRPSQQLTMWGRLFFKTRYYILQQINKSSSHIQKQ